LQIKSAGEHAEVMPVARWAKDIAIVIISAFGGIYLLMAIGSGAFSSKAPAKTVDISLVPAGSEGRLSTGSAVIPVAIDEETLPDLKRAIARNDLTGVAPMFVVNDDTLVRVSETGSGGLRVTILTGSQKGRAGWVPFEWVKPR
jgi:hypothetical protein